MGKFEEVIKEMEKEPKRSYRIGDFIIEQYSSSHKFDADYVFLMVLPIKPSEYLGVMAF